MAFHVERPLNSKYLAPGFQMFISLSGTRTIESLDEISAIRLSVSSSSFGSYAYTLAMYMAESPSLSKLKLFLEVFRGSFKHNSPASLAIYMNRVVGAAYTIHPWCYMPILLDRHNLPLQGDLFYLPVGRVIVSWHLVKVVVVRLEQGFDPDQVSVLVKDEEIEEEFWVPAGYLYTAI